MSLIHIWDIGCHLYIENCLICNWKLKWHLVPRGVVLSNQPEILLRSFLSVQICERSPVLLFFFSESCLCLHWGVTVLTMVGLLISVWAQQHRCVEILEVNGRGTGRGSAGIEEPIDRRGQRRGSRGVLRQIGASDKTESAEVHSYLQQKENSTLMFLWNMWGHSVVYWQFSSSKYGKTAAIST